MEGVFMNIPIIMAAFGTTTKALKTYSFIDDIVKKKFPEHKIIWAYSSRIVKHKVKLKNNTDIKDPHQVIGELTGKGHNWAIVQSMYLLCGHEFYRLLQQVQNCGVRTSIGLPLLSFPEDYMAVARSLINTLPKQSDRAIVLVGHGTDHPAWSSYSALMEVFRNQTESKVFIGTLEEKIFSCESVVEAVKKQGFKKVLLVPLLLVAGTHFYEDLVGDEDSWKACFEKEQIEVSTVSEGIGFNPGIVDIFCQHIKNALDIIPN